MKKENKKVFLRYAYSSSVMYTTLNYSVRIENNSCPDREFERFRYENLILDNRMATPTMISADSSHYYSSLLAEEGEKAKAFYWDKTNVAMKENIMKFRSFHQSSISLSDDLLCSSYPGGMDIRSSKAQNRYVMKIQGRKQIGRIIGSSYKVSTAFDTWTAISTGKLRGKIGQDESMRNVRNAGWVLPILIMSYERREER